jgi:hypothetical protein
VGRLVELAAPNDSLDGTKMYATLASSHKMGTCVMTSIGEMSPAMIQILHSHREPGTDNMKIIIMSKKSPSLSINPQQYTGCILDAIPLLTLSDSFDNFLDTTADAFVLCSYSNTNHQHTTNHQPMITMMALSNAPYPSWST